MYVTEIRTVLATQYHAKLFVNNRTRQMAKENCAEQGVRFCTRGSVRRYVTERARFSQRSYARFYSSSE